MIGSSMGGWIGLKLLLNMTKRKTAFIGIAPAADFTEKLMPMRHDEKNKTRLEAQGYVEVACDYDPDGDPFIITQHLLEDGDKNSIMNNKISYDAPVRILQGMLDEDVPYKHNLEMIDLITSQNIVLNLIKDGDHRLSRHEDLVRLLGTVHEVMELMTNNIKS